MIFDRTLLSLCYIRNMYIHNVHMYVYVLSVHSPLSIYFRMVVDVFVCARGFVLFGTL